MSKSIADPAVQVILTTGGTGFTGRDSTPEAIACCSTRKSRASASCSVAFSSGSRQLHDPEPLSGRPGQSCRVFCLPGSTGACRTAWNGILKEQLDSRHRPCNFADLVIPERGTHAH
ncbi:molybdopterin-binding protein [Cobetia marina]